MTSLSENTVVTTSGGLIELGYVENNSNTAITSTTAGSGDTVISALTVVCDGSPIVVEFFSPQVRPQASVNCEINISLYEDGVEETRQWGRFYNGAGGPDNKPAQLTRRLTPSAGIHTYSVKAYVSSGSGIVGGGSGGGTGFAPCFLRVSKIVQATQWPAVTTGTIICTSSTRPASPFEGQTIYETDNSRQLVWNGSAWVAPSVTYRPPMCKVRRTSNVTSYGSSTEFTWQAEDYDTDAMWTSGTDVTINTDGVYVLTFEGLASIATSWSLVEPKILVNGTAVAQNIVAFWGTFARWTVATAVPLVATDTVTASLGFLGTGAVTVYGGASPSIDGARLAVVWQGQAS